MQGIKSKLAQLTGETVMTRSRSASSSQSSNSGSSSSDSSSSGSSSSSSSSSSDSSSSDTEASRASSRASRRSKSSQKGASVTPVKSNATKPTAAPAKKSTPAAAKAASSAAINKSRTSGVINNTKVIPRARAPAKNRKVSPPPKNTDAVWTSEDESTTANESVTSTPIKKVGSKPPGKIVTVTAKPQAVKMTAAGKKRKTPAANGKQAGAAKKTPAKVDGKSQKGGSAASASKKMLKSIFSPENSSEGSGDEKKADLGTNLVNGTQKIIKGKPPPRSRKKEILGSDADKDVPVNKGSASSSQSSQSSSSSGSSSSDTNSGSESKRKPAKESVREKKDASPSSGSGGRKRPVTRRRTRRTLNPKTIPTTTVFNHTALTKVNNQSQSWDSDFSDEPKSLARVPTKTTQKMRMKPPHDDDDEVYERERKCPFPCCDSQGHLSGKYPTHYMLTTCPMYHGFRPEECKENAEERSKREIERKKYYTPNQHHFKKPAKLSAESKIWMNKVKESKAQDTLGGLCSQYDLSLWNDALAIAAGQIETEQGESLSHRSVAMGRWEMSCWCQSPYPEPLCHCRRLFICEFCLKPVQSGTVLRRHCAKCVWRHPPGDEIYRKDRLSVWEVDGKSQKTYCQNLCLLAKCFLDHKTLYLDVDPFLFYVMTLADSTGCHIVGYFSKEKNQSFLNYNVSCILTLPPYMRQGYGRLLIEFSYLLTRVEGKVGSPEKPLSDLGLISYRSYWKDAVLRRMCACASRDLSIKDLSNELGVSSADLVSTLQFLGMLKYWKGKHLILKKQDVLEDYLERVRRRGEQRSIDSSCLRWRPYQPPPEAST